MTEEVVKGNGKFVETVVPSKEGATSSAQTAGPNRASIRGGGGRGVAGDAATVRPTVTKGQRGAVPVPVRPTGKGKAAVGAPVTALPPLPRMRKKQVPKECQCGCGYMTKGGNFIPGHDSKLKGWALRVERKVITLKDIPDEGTRKAVAKMMKVGNGTK